MLYEELKRTIENAQIDVSGTASDVLQYVLDRYDEDDEDIDESDIYDAIMEECDNYFIYYSDAWDYLQDNSITDFADAFDEVGATDICSIACYFLNQEINENLDL